MTDELGIIKLYYLYSFYIFFYIYLSVPFNEISERAGCHFLSPSQTFFNFFFNFFGRTITTFVWDKFSGRSK